ncbi:polyribonucleotide nucleotidyltransferase [Guyparkeria sp. 1SP6A2]|nr:polyribonucleotide nucleotidyltransferase [Guyparkeria sp. 1SP6A2]
MAVTKQSFEYGQHTVVLETGEIARQASGAVMVTMGETVVLVTAVVAPKAEPGKDFLPLTVEYQEKFYAAGRVPGSFFRREGRSTEAETLVARLIDRPVRPLFPKGFYHETQVIAQVLSLDPEVDADIPALIGASAALSLSGAPFAGPIGAARIGHVDGEFVLNPSPAQLAESRLDLIVAGTDKAVLMVESEADQLPEQTMLDAVMFGHEQMQAAIGAIEALAAEAAKAPIEWTPPVDNSALAGEIDAAFRAQIESAYQVADKAERGSRLGQIRGEIRERFVDTDAEPAVTEKTVDGLVKGIESDVVRGDILAGKPRIDGRDSRTVRPISIRTGILPRAHGSALFTRGETQAMVVTTLGTARDAQMIDAVGGERKEPFLFHYNFPPFCVGETGRFGMPKRREIGHGNLARRGVMAALPPAAEFPYTIRVVSEITESNGSSSMASVCGASLAMMDAGVPMKAPVAGIAMGLIKEGDRFVVLTDILGDEDHLGDMDFKVAGTAAGINALQMDIKIEGINREIMEEALREAQSGRTHILGCMGEALAEARTDLSAHAPRFITMRINPERKGDLIGKGGATIQALTKETGTQIDIGEEGVITIAAPNGEAAEEARRQIELLTAELEVGKIYHGKVVRVVDFGAFVNIAPGKDGLLHISEMAEGRVENVTDVVKEGDEIDVKLLEIDKQGRLRLTLNFSR